MDNLSFFDTARSTFRSGLAEADRKWKRYFALGALLVLLGSVAVGSAVATTALSVGILSCILLAAGAGLIALSFMTGRWSGFLLTLAAGALSAIAGVTMLSYPVAGAVAVTLVVGTMLIAGGIFRSVAAVVMAFPNWGWSVASGLMSLAMGTILLRNWQIAGLYFIGACVGVDLIVHGFSWMMFSMRLHRLAARLDVGETYRRAA